MIFVVIGVGLVIVSVWEVARALKTGRLRLRVASITRETNPGVFWFDVAACAVTAILGALFGLHFLLVIPWPILTGWSQFRPACRGFSGVT